MPRIKSVRLAAACALVAAMSLTIAAGAAAKGFSADLRVVGSGGKILTEKKVKTASTTLKSSPKATCFGPGSGGSGDRVTLKGNTAMGLLARASKSTKTLRPLRISDSFDFGLALCGIGSSVARGEASWYLKVNHRALSVGGDAARIKPGDDVLWALAPSFPYPDELALTAPRGVKRGATFSVRAFSYDEKGKRTPAAGIKVSGAGKRTGADGRTKVTLKRPRYLVARKGDLIPARAAVCVAGNCPGGR